MQVQGQILLLPNVKHSIKAIIHWSERQYCRGLNPENTLFPIEEVTTLSRNHKSHAIFVVKLKTAVKNAKPSTYQEKTKW